MGNLVEMPGSPTPHGAWGLRFPSLGDAAHVLVDAPEWPAVDLDLHCDSQDVDDSNDWDEHGMSVPLPAGGHLRIRWPYAVTLHLPGHPVPECVVQPHLTTAAASIAMRGGRQPFHAGAFAVEGRVWGVLGAKEAGKSSTLALASSEGADIVTDDLLVVDGGSALAGPRCIDLRAEPARVLETGTYLGTVGLRERYRVHVGPCPRSLPVAGFVVPSWGEDGVAPLPPVARLQVLFANSSMQGVTMNLPDQYLRLASLPMLGWSRPKSWTTARQSFRRLLDVLVGSPVRPA